MLFITNCLVPLPHRQQTEKVTLGERGHGERGGEAESWRAGRLLLLRWTEIVGGECGGAEVVAVAGDAGECGFFCIKETLRGHRLLR